jgi:aminomethyltransferase
MAESKDALQRTALYDWHVEHGGRMVPFAGWEMPVQYPTAPLIEHQTTRQAAGLFDIDHMGQMEVRGPEAEIFVNHIVTYDVSKMKLFDAHYGILCYEDGGSVDDLFIYKLPEPNSKDAECYFLIVINASNRAKDVAWVQSHTAGFDVQVRDISDETYMMAFQGPQAPAILNRISRGDVEAVRRFTAVQDVLLGDVPVLLGRTGYTGEDGFELFFNAEQAVRVWEALLKAGEPEGVKAIGLAARDSLRFEACMPLYGHELSPTITPVEAGLNFALSLDRDFIGRDALLKQKLEGSGRALVGLELIDKGVAREGFAIQHNGQVVGSTTSGLFAPTLKSFLAMAYVPRSLSARGTELEIMIREKATRAKIVKKPFYVPAYRRQGA